MALGADDPLLFGSRLAGQYATMRAAHDLTDDQLADLARMSVSASRAPSDVVKTMLADIDAWLAGFETPIRLRIPATFPPHEHRRIGVGRGVRRFRQLQRAADEHRLVDQGDAELLAYAVPQLAREDEQVVGGR